MTNQSLLEIIAILIALLSIAWSAVTFYLTYLRKAKLKVIYPRVLAFSKIEKGNAAIAVPLVFVNYGARLGIVEELSWK